MSQSRKSDEKVQLYVPEISCREVSALCHEQVSGYLGTTKSKNRVLRCYFWPNCNHDIETYMKTCDPCQKVGSIRDKRKAPIFWLAVFSCEKDVIYLTVHNLLFVI